ncbi:MAG: saccharopine dehydrogenase family protein [Candidatus Helarchaeota archaeon]
MTNDSDKEIRLLILGAAGDMGSYALKKSVDYKVYSKITIGDINEDKSKKLIKELNDPRLCFEKVNAFNNEQLINLMKKHDIIISCIGPFYIFGPLIVRAAIQAKKPLIDICDDYSATLEILQMDEDAKKAGVPIFLGYGWTPGISNILARCGYNKLDKDKPIRINIAWLGDVNDSEGLAVVMHVFYAMIGKVPSFLNYKLIDVPAGKGYYRLKFPEPIGLATVFDCGHPEPITIPKYLNNVQECTVKGGIKPDWSNKFAYALKHLHLLQGKRRIKLISKIIYNLESLFFGNVETPKSGLRVDLYGQISGKEVHLVYATPVLKMGNLTGFPAAIAAKLYAEGKIDGIGILPPESQDPNQYIKELEKIDIKIIYDDRGIPEIFDESKPYKLKFFEKYTYTIILISAQIIIICLFVFLFLWIFKVF